MHSCIQYLRIDTEAKCFLLYCIVLLWLCTWMDAQQVGDTRRPPSVSPTLSTRVCPLAHATKYSNLSFCTTAVSTIDSYDCTQCSDAVACNEWQLQHTSSTSWSAPCPESKHQPEHTYERLHERQWREPLRHCAKSRRPSYKHKPQHAHNTSLLLRFDARNPQAL